MYDDINDGSQYQNPDDLWPPESVPDISREEAVRTAEQMSQEAQDANSPKCVEGESVFYFEYPEALVPGHIYSRTGIDEFRISKMCEFHFDNAFAGVEE